MDNKVYEKIHRMVNNELEHHPEAQLLDLYKLFLQSAFGPGHMIKDLNSAKEFLQAEITNKKNYISKFNDRSKNIYLNHLKIDYKEESDDIIECPCLLLECSAFLPLIRYSTKFVLDEIIPFNDYFNAFIKTTNMKEFLSEKDFCSYWQATMEYLETKRIYNFEEDKALINRLISTRQYLVSHSAIYTKKYTPAYRIINKDFLKKYDPIIKERYFLY